VKSVSKLTEVYQGNTFVSAVAAALATKGLTKEEYMRIAKVFGTSQARFAAYINHFKKKGFNIVLEGGRYFEHPVQDIRTGSLAQKTESLKPIGVSTPKAVAVEVPARSRLWSPRTSCERNVTLVHSREDYEWAKRAAVDGWNGSEGEMHEGLLFTESNFSGEILFGAFLSKFGIARCVTKVGKQLLLEEFISNWRSGWENAKPGDFRAYQSVDRFARLISEKSWASIEGATLTSLASKMAFMSNPAVFFPYDRYSFKGLSRCGLRLTVHDYPAYMSAFMEISKYLPADLEVDLPLLMSKMKRRITQCTLRMRILDKLMMKVGQFQAG
jgi:hypothetical protein